MPHAPLSALTIVGARAASLSSRMRIVAAELYGRIAVNAAAASRTASRTSAGWYSVCIDRAAPTRTEEMPALLAAFAFSPADPTTPSLCA